MSVIKMKLNCEKEYMKAKIHESDGNYVLLRHVLLSGDNYPLEMFKLLWLFHLIIKSKWIFPEKKYFKLSDKFTLLVWKQKFDMKVLS